MNFLERFLSLSDLGNALSYCADTKHENHLRIRVHPPICQNCSSLQEFSDKVEANWKRFHELFPRRPGPKPQPASEAVIATKDGANLQPHEVVAVSHATTAVSSVDYPSLLFPHENLMTGRFDFHRLSANYSSGRWPEYRLSHFGNAGPNYAYWLHQALARTIEEINASRRQKGIVQLEPLQTAITAAQLNQGRLPLEISLYFLGEVATEHNIVALLEALHVEVVSLDLTNNRIRVRFTPNGMAYGYKLPELIRLANNPAVPVIAYEPTNGCEPPHLSAARQEARKIEREMAMVRAIRGAKSVGPKSQDLPPTTQEGVPVAR